MLRDGALERRVDLAEAVLEDVGEADEDGKADAAELQAIDQLLEVDRARRILGRMHLDVPGAVDREVAVAPARNLVELARVVHASMRVVDEVLAASGGAAARPFVIVLICAIMINAFRSIRSSLIGRSANFLEGGALHTYAGRMSERVPAIKVVMMPKDTNAHGTIFGGVILSQHRPGIGRRGASRLRRICYVTKAMREVEFHEPVFTGDLVSFYPSSGARRADVGDHPRRGRGRAVGRGTRPGAESDAARRSR